MVTGHGSDLDASGGEELPDLCGVLDDMAGNVSDEHSEDRAVVSVSGRQRSSGCLLGEGVEGSADPAAAPLDVSEQLWLCEHAVGKGVGVVVEGLRG